MEFLKHRKLSKKCDTSMAFIYSVPSQDIPIPFQNHFINIIVISKNVKVTTRIHQKGN